jgi:hypothetical protein
MRAMVHVFSTSDDAALSAARSRVAGMTASIIARRRRTTIR